MSNFGIKIDLLKLKGAFMTNIKGKTATKRCLVLPVDECDGVFLGEKGCYLSMTGIEMKEPKYSDTHCIKVDLPKDQRAAMSEEQLNAIPILGGMHAIERQQQTMVVTSSVELNPFDTGDDDDLPF